MTIEQEEKLNRDIEIITFYSIAKKYGFCNPYCECELCNKPV